MSWYQQLPGPSWKDYEAFRHDLAARTPGENIQTCLGVFFSMLIVVPIVVLFLAGLFLVLSTMITYISYGFLLLGLAGYLILKGCKGILEEEMSVLPRTRIQSETSFVGGRVSRKVKGAAAKRLGSILVALGVVALAVSICFFLQALQ